jgi:hypothetical protein
MPLLFRVMRHDSQDTAKPEVSDRFACLGVRAAEIQVSDGMVGPAAGGMSVQPSVGVIPFMLAPKKYRHIIEGAAGPDSRTIWRLGSGTFKDGPVAQNLQLRVSPAEADQPITHGEVEPDASMSIEAFQSALGATVESWKPVLWK